MTSAVRDLSALRFSARLVVFGLWTVVFGLLMLFTFTQLFSTVTSQASVASFGETSGVGIESMLVDSFLLLFHGGFLTLGIGATMTFFGGVLIIRVSR